MEFKPLVRLQGQEPEPRVTPNVLVNPSGPVGQGSTNISPGHAVHAAMEAAGLDGPQASPKGLRHGFGVAAVSAGIPLNLVQKWLGHAQLTTTAIYANAVGAEEKDIARRMWG